MKRFIALLLLLFSTFALTGCISTLLDPDYRPHHRGEYVVVDNPHSPWGNGGSSLFQATAVAVPASVGPTFNFSEKKTEVDEIRNQALVVVQK